MTETQLLSPEDFKEFKALVVEEYGNTMSDEEIRDMVVRLLGLYDLLYSALADGRNPRLSKHEIMAFVYIKIMLCEFHHTPSVREIARFLGRRSSRSGQNVLDRLIFENVIERRRDGRLYFGSASKKPLDLLRPQ